MGRNAPTSADSGVRPPMLLVISGFMVPILPTLALAVAFLSFSDDSGDSGATFGVIAGGILIAALAAAVFTTVGLTWWALRLMPHHKLPQLTTVGFYGYGAAIGLAFGAVSLGWDTMASGYLLGVSFLLWIGGATVLAVSRRTPPSAAPRWQSDPSGRHQWRWWDGTRWTSCVGDEGITSMDPFSPDAAARTATVKPNIPRPGKRPSSGQHTKWQWRSARERRARQTQSR